MEEEDTNTRLANTQEFMGFTCVMVFVAVEIVADVDEESDSISVNERDEISSPETSSLRTLRAIARDCWGRE